MADEQGDGDESSSPSSVVRSLLSHCRQNLHGNDVLSLRQLVPVHQTLCQCILMVKEKLNDKALLLDCEQMPESMESILKIRCLSSDDQRFCREILIGSSDNEESAVSDPSEDAERLLVLQYLMFPLSFIDSLRWVLIPFLLTDTSYSVSEDLELALLDWLEVTAWTMEDTPIWQDVLKVLTASPNPAAARILVRLLKRQPQFPLLLQALYDKLWRTVLAVVASPPVSSSIHPSTTFQNHPNLSVLSKDLMPLLTQITADGVAAVATELHRSCIHRLWTRLFAELWWNMNETVAISPANESLSEESQKRVAMLVITTVLCPLLPHLEHYELPLVEKAATAATTSSFANPLRQPSLWDLIYQCVSQGTSSLEAEGMAALSSILRRRGLFLLNNIVTTNEWKQYVMCYETLEMESEQHLVDQIWEYVGGLFEKVVDDDRGTYGVLTWDWMSQLFGCVLSASLPVVRKMGMHRLLKAHVQSHEADEATATSKKNKKNRKVKSKSMKSASILDKMPPDFVLRILLPSWNSLGRTVGFTMHIELENRRLEHEDMIPIMKRVLKSYVGDLNAARAHSFWRGLWDWNLQQHFATKVFVMIFQLLAEELQNSIQPLEIPVGDDDIKSLIHMLDSFFAGNSVVVNLRREILGYVAEMLAHVKPLSVDGKVIDKWNPVTMLRLLCLYKQEYYSLDSDDWNIQNEATLMNLKILVEELDQNVADISSVLATAFVDGQLGLSNNRAWDPEYGAHSNERQMAWAILLLASLSSSGSIQLTTSQLIWPAINKGLSNTAGAIMTSSYIKADHVTRALLLLESGCLMRELSGLGNGDLVVLDKNTRQLMPPPPNIESMLSSAVDFCLFHIRTLLSIEANEGTSGAMQTSSTYARLVSMLRTLHQSFPSSQAISTAMEILIKSSTEAIADGGGNDVHRVMHTTLIYAALSSGAELSAETYIPISRSIVTLGLKGDSRDRSNTWEHMARSILFYAKWASISRILPLLGKAMDGASESYVKDTHEFLEWVLAQAFDSVSVTALDAVVPVFNCIIEASKLWIADKTSTETGSSLYVDTLERIIASLIDLMQEASLSYDGVYMLNQICTLVFQPQIMREEYERFSRDPCAKTPIRDGFRRLLEMAGSERAHINRSVMCKVAIGWLGPDPNDKMSLGMNAIPYRDDIVDLLVHKEIRKDEAATNQNRMQKIDGMAIPAETNELSLTRAFVLVFFEKIPDPGNGLNDTVLKELLEPVILGLLVKAEPIMSTKPSLIMKGTPTYCMKMRAWQALCTLARFVTPSIAKQVCNSTFECVQESIHSQVRYFVEIFAVKSGMNHPDVFGSTFLEEIMRTDLTLQQIASLVSSGTVAAAFVFHASASLNNVLCR